MDYLKKHSLVFILILLFIFTLSIVVKVYNKKLGKAQSEISVLTLDNQKYEVVKNTLNQKVVKQTAVIVQDKEVIKTLSDKVFKLKDQIKGVVTYYQEVTSTNWDTAFIPFIDTIYITDTIEVGDVVSQTIKDYLDSSIKVPNTFERDSSLFTIKGKVLKNGVRIDSLDIPDTFNLRVVETKGKLFRPSFIEFQAMHSNPLISVKGAKSIQYEVKKKNLFQWITDKAIWIGVGILTALLIK